MTIPQWPRGGDEPDLETLTTAARDATREDILAWLQWNDPNGAYTDDLAAANGEDPISREDALSEFCAAMVDMFSMEDARISGPDYALRDRIASELGL